MLVRDEIDGRPLAGRTANGESERSVSGRQQEERGREDGPGLLLRVTEETPGPLARLNAPGGEIRELGVDEVEACRHQVVKDPALQPERRPVEIVMRYESFVLLAAGACEQDLKDGGMRSAGESFELAKRGQ